MEKKVLVAARKEERNYTIRINQQHSKKWTVQMNHHYLQQSFQE